VRAWRAQLSVDRPSTDNDTHVAAAASYNLRADSFGRSGARGVIVTGPLPKRTHLAVILCLPIAALTAPRPASADAGPPFITNDPGTPGNGNWEINVAAMQTKLHGISTLQLPQLDVNYGLGERIQLTGEIPYVVANASGETQASGWGNANPGVKWRFFDQGEEGWRLSIFPMYQTGVSAEAQGKGIGVAGPRFFLPVEVARKVGSLSFNLEAGTYMPVHGDHEDILGLVVGQPLNSRLELDGELYYDRIRGGTEITTFDVGGRYHLHRGFNLLFLAGRSLHGNSPGQIEFIGYLGIQVLLSNYGRTLSSEP
jgi:hypothetical protein